MNDTKIFLKMKKTKGEKRPLKDINIFLKKKKKQKRHYYCECNKNLPEEQKLVVEQKQKKAS